MSTNHTTGIFTLRLVALFRKSRHFVAFVIIFFGISTSVTFTMLVLALNTYNSTTFILQTYCDMVLTFLTCAETIDYFDLVGLCGALHAAPTFPAMFYAPAAYEAFLFITTAYKAYQDASVFSNGTTTPFVIVLYRGESARIDNMTHRLTSGS
jgi:hypothetical protein